MRQKTFRMKERDLDIIILEELHSNSGFSEWFADRIGIESGNFQSAEHSVTAKANAKWGETDVLAFFTSGDRTIAVLIEDKIAADFTDDQVGRYHERAEQIIDNNHANDYLTVLIAPNDYLDRMPENNSRNRKSEWDRKLKIEDIRDWFKIGLDPHKKWRADALSACLERIKSNLSAKEEEIRRFSKDFSAFLCKQFDGKFSHKFTSDSGNFIITPSNKKSNVEFGWKIGKCLVDLTFSRTHVGKAAKVKAADLPRCITRRLSADEEKLGSDVFSIEVSPSNFNDSFASQTDVAEEVMDAVQRLMSIVSQVLGTNP